MDNLEGKIAAALADVEYWLITERDDRGNPTQIEALDPQDVTTVRDEDGRIVGYLIDRSSRTSSTAATKARTSATAPPTSKIRTGTLTAHPAQTQAATPEIPTDPAAASPQPSPPPGRATHQQDPAPHQTDPAPQQEG